MESRMVTTPDGAYQPHGMYFEQFRTGQVFTTTRRTVTEADFAMFAWWSGDANPLQTDAVEAAASRFGARIASGFALLSMAAGMIRRLGIYEGTTLALVGIDGWKFRKPVFIGDTITIRLTITGTRPTSGGELGLVERQTEILNQHEEVVASGRLDVLMLREGAAA